MSKLSNWVYNCHVEIKELEKPSFRMCVCLLMHQNWHRQVKNVSQEVMKRGLWICRSQILEVIVLFQTRYADRATEKTVPPSEFRRWKCKSRSGAMKSEAGGGRSAWSDEQRREFSSLWVIGGGEVRKWGEGGKQHPRVNTEGGTLWRGEPGHFPARGHRTQTTSLIGAR